ncbi:MAG: GTP-binding protein [Candidatus Heimdallarchaeota archaeon]|nr:GTP-binding protein [Candidatus Heimdallarchaeota archaeon]MDH5645814.1 GTP-binding protein [Candidatus Heimdallarchaeota archaeon]
MSEIDVYSIKLILIGNASVGKTSIRRKFMGISLKQGYTPTIGFDISIKNVITDNYEAICSIYDIGADAYFNRMKSKYYQNIAGIILVFDATSELNEESRISYWIDEIKENHGNRDIPFLILGNKSDLLENKDKFTDLGKSMKTFVKDQLKISDVGFYLTSAKTSENVNTSFNWLIERIISNHKK